MTDLAEQRLRERGLAATGEVVTAETLRQARERRDLGWSLVRRTYVDGEGDPRTLGLGFDPDRPLPEAFEAAQAGADRQADLLRSDAERAAVYADCAKRIEQMEARRAAIAKAREEGEARRLGQEARWAEALAQAGLPALEPQALREWQAGRLAALDLADRQARVAADLAQRRADLDAASQALAAALVGVGRPRPPRSRRARPWRGWWIRPRAGRPAPPGPRPSRASAPGRRLSGAPRRSVWPPTWPRSHRT